MTLQDIFSFVKRRKTFPDYLRDFLAPVPYVPLFFERYHILRSLQETVPLASPGAFLDVGCGMKPYESLFVERFTSYLGLDYPTTMEGSYGQGTRADVFASCTDLPFSENSFDTVITTQVLEHVSEPQTMLREIARVLKTDGIIILSAPMCWPLHEVPHDYFRYTEFSLHDMLQQSGFEILHAVKRGDSCQTLFQLFIDLFFSVRTDSPKLIRYLSYLFNTLLVLFGWLASKFFPNERLYLGMTFVGRKTGCGKTE